MIPLLINPLLLNNSRPCTIVADRLRSQLLRLHPPWRLVARPRLWLRSLSPWLMSSGFARRHVTNASIRLLHRFFLRPPIRLQLLPRLQQRLLPSNKLLSHRLFSRQTRCRPIVFVTVMLTVLPMALMMTSSRFGLARRRCSLVPLRHLVQRFPVSTASLADRPRRVRWLLFVIGLCSLLCHPLLHRRRLLDLSHCMLAVAHSHHRRHRHRRRRRVHRFHHRLRLLLHLLHRLG